MQVLRQGFGRSCGGKHTVPRRCTKALDGFTNGGGVGQGSDTFFIHYAQNFEFARFDEGNRRGHALHRQGHLTADHIGGRKGRAFVGNVLQLDVGCFLQHLGNEVVQGAIACGGDGVFAGLQFGQADEFGHGVGGKGGVRHQHITRLGQRCHRLKVLDRIKAGFSVQSRVDDLCAVGGHEQGVPVRLGLGRQSGAHIAARACPVFDHKGLAGLL